MKNLNKSILATFVGIAGIAACSSILAASCPRDQGDLQSTIDLYSRALRVTDPAHADQDINLLTNIVTGKASAVMDLLSKGLNPNLVFTVPGGASFSLLGVAASSCQDEVARVLVHAGADVNGDGSSSIPLTSAAVSGDAPLTEFLLQRGASVDKVDIMGHTPLEAAVRVRQIQTVKVLLIYDHNANRDIGRGGTVLDIVGNSKDPTDVAIAQELRSHGVSSKLSADSK